MPSRSLQRICLLAAVLLLSAPGSLHARELTHTVARGQILLRIAERYHTTVEAIRKTNKLAPGQLLRVGQKLRIEESDAHRRWREYLEEKRGVRKEPAPAPKQVAAKRAVSKRPTTTKPAAAPPADPPKTDPDSLADKYARRPRQPGWVNVVRGSAQFRGRLVDARRAVVSAAVPRMERMLRSIKGKQTGKIEPRLLQLLADVSDHFGGRKIVVVSGFRPQKPGQYTKNSRHNHGEAIDFYVEGVPNEAVRDYCLRLKKVGVGYYPNSYFVHLDVRSYKTSWTDYSKPGQPPRYAKKTPPPAAAAAKSEPGRRAGGQAERAPSSSPGS